MSIQKDLSFEVRTFHLVDQTVQDSQEGCPSAVCGAEDGQYLAVVDVQNDISQYPLAFLKVEPQIPTRELDFCFYARLFHPVHHNLFRR
jgi:hypothetical protein